MAEADLQSPGTAAAAPVEAAPAEAGAKPSRRWGRLVLMLVVPLAIIAGGLYYWQSLQGKITTDNAYVKQDMVAVSAEVGGRITQVLVDEDAHVEAGDLLFRIDPEPYRLEMAQANASIASAQANITALRNSPDLTGVDIAAAREDIAFAQSQFERQAALWERGFTTKADYDAARHAVSQAQEALHQAQARQSEAQALLANGAAVPDRNPQIAAAEALRESAALNLRRTEVHAPMAGRVAQASRLQLGQQVLPNLPVLTLVGDGTSYIEANFKETELAEMAPGQRAEIRFDAYPDMVLEGHVDSIGAGTGSQFSILPAQNATGNWVKVTQRVPVRIAIDSTGERELIAGLSAEVTVFTDAEAK